MTFRVRTAVVPALLAGSVAAACSSSSPRSPGAYVNATLRTSATSPSTLCGFTSQDVVMLGTDTSPIPTRALDGDVTSTGRASISCSVAAKSDGFDINLSASVGGMGTLIVLGHVTSQGGETVTTSFQTTGGALSPICAFSRTRTPVRPYRRPPARP